MELAEPIESINKQLLNLFGLDSITGRTMFRVVWSEDQYEMRMTDRTDSGIQLLTPELRELPKYKQWIKERFVLERLVLVPEADAKELPTIKLSYEPLWVFKGAEEQYVPPTTWACKFVIDTLYAALGKGSLVRYVDEESKNPQEMKEKRINKLTEELFGDESSLLGRTITGEAMAMPKEYISPQKESVS
jgi:hypothetical protein